MPQPPKRILCVEDNEDICFMITTVLERAGYSAESASSLSEAQVLTGREHFDLYILDTKLGEESGLDLCRTLRVAHPDTPVIIYSAAVFDTDREAGLSAGACAFVTKPGTEGLVEAVRNVLGTA